MAAYTIGLGPAEAGRMHFDIYAVLEGTQELYFGHDVEVNVNMVETVNVMVPNAEPKEGEPKYEEVRKCYLSPTKRRGVERRSLIWAPTGKGDFLGNALECTIPKTCVNENCPICSVFGGLDAGKKTYVGRLVHGGGTAVQTLEPEEKQRAMHPARLRQEGDETPMPFKRQYDPPGLLFPVYNHCLSVTDDEFSAVAYAFLDSLARLGAGNPKGLNLFEAALFDGGPEPALVVDRYLSPVGRRPTISPTITDVAEALDQFARAAKSAPSEHERFTRHSGDAALKFLQACADSFVERELQSR